MTARRKTTISRRVEMLGNSGAETIAVMMPADLVAHIRSVCTALGLPPDDWFYEAALLRLQRDAREMRVVLQFRQLAPSPADPGRHREEAAADGDDVGIDHDAQAQSKIGAIDQHLNKQWVAAVEAGDSGEERRLSRLKLGFKRQIQDLAGAELHHAAQDFLRHLDTVVR